MVIYNLLPSKEGNKAVNSQHTLKLGNEWAHSAVNLLQFWERLASLSYTFLFITSLTLYVQVLSVYFSKTLAGGTGEEGKVAF